MAIQTETVESILRPLASRKDADGNLDSRFDALRCKHDCYIVFRYGDGSSPICQNCGFDARQGLTDWGIDTSLGAIVCAAAACGLRFMFVLKEHDPTVPSLDFYWECHQVLEKKNEVPRLLRTISWMADTPELAAAKALVAAVRSKDAH